MKKQQNANQEQTTNGEEFLQTEPAPEKSFLEMSALIREKFETTERLKAETKDEILRRIAEKNTIISEAHREMRMAEAVNDIDLCTQVKERIEDAEGFIKFYVEKLEAIVAGKYNMCKPGEVEQLAREALNAAQRELDIITEKTGDEPILLLDDVLAELDDIRQNYLLKSISNSTQTIITSVDTILFEEEFLKDVQIYKIENGKIIN